MSQGAGVNAKVEIEEALTRGPLPASREIYLAGSRDDLLVPMREIRLSPTPVTGATSPGKLE